MLGRGGWGGVGCRLDSVHVHHCRAVRCAAAEWGGTNEAAQFLLPAALSLEGGQLSAGGAYLLDNGRVFLLWLGAGVAIEYVAQVRHV